MGKITELKTRNKRIIDFYERNKELDFETSNIMIIELYEKMLESKRGEMTSILSNQILSELKSQYEELNIFKKEMCNLSEKNNITSHILNNELLMLKELLNKMNNDISNNIITKLYDIKQLYTEDLKLILSNNQNEHINKVLDKIDRENNIIVERMDTVLSDTLGKNIKGINGNYENIIKGFQEEMKSIRENIGSISLDGMSTLIESKYNNLLQMVQHSVLNSVSQSEDRMNVIVNEIKNITLINGTNQERINEELLEYLNKYKNSSCKGQIGESKLEFILNKLYGNDEIIRSSNKTNSGDFILKRENKPKILFENKDYNHQVDKSEINKFIMDIENTDCHGIFLSQYSSISNKKNYQIEKHKDKILIYVNFVEYNSDKVSVAVDIIDDLVKRMDINTNNNILSDEILEHINNEYSIFANKKETFLTFLRESNKKSIEMVTEMELHTLESYLSSKFATTKLNNYNCEICNKFAGKNRMSLASHKKYCKINP
jgi:hypothetical protein